MTTINPLANPKGVNLVCELCQKPAYLQCTDCRVTYYCGNEHQKIDWIGIHEKICQQLIPLRQTSEPFLASEDERAKRKDNLLLRKKNMIDLTRTTGQKLLFEGLYSEAIPAALQSLRYSIDVHDISSVELVPSYLILGEASIGLGNFEQAQEYLNQAQWTILKADEYLFKSKLYRILGLLYYTKGDLEESLRNFSDDIYHSSEEHGCDSVHTSGGYYHMANAFVKQGNLSKASSLFEKVTEIWSAHLSEMVQVATRPANLPNTVVQMENQKAVEEQLDAMLDPAQEAEAVKVLTAILEFRRNQPEPSSNEEMALILYALSMLKFIQKKDAESVVLVREAVRKAEQIEDDAMNLLEDITSFAQSVGE